MAEDAKSEVVIKRSFTIGVYSKGKLTDIRCVETLEEAYALAEKASRKLHLPICKVFLPE